MKIVNMDGKMFISSELIVNMDGKIFISSEQLEEL